MKAHLALSDSPIQQGDTVKTLCGVELGAAEAIPIWDEQGVMTTITLPVGICQKCVNAMFKSHGRYAYAVAQTFSRL
jgi:hypothetical protein